MTPIEPLNEDVEESPRFILQKFLENVDSIKDIIVVAMDKDGDRISMRKTRAGLFNESVMVQFLQAGITRRHILHLEGECDCDK